MRNWIFLFIICLFALCGGCSKPKVSSHMKYTPEDITSVTIKISTPEESEILDEGSTEGIQEFMKLLEGIDITEMISKDTQEETWYYHYSFHLKDGGKVNFIDYQDKLKVIDEQDKVYWYEISTNTWEELSDLWKKYYVSPNMYNFPWNQPTGVVDPEGIKAKKPVIYLYPEEPTEVSIGLELNGILGYTYPEYHSGWKVLAYPDGTLRNCKDDKNYSYLFWEGVIQEEIDLSKGFVVKGSDMTGFLEDKLSILGLTNREMNDFIVYWAPEMTNNPYNLISFIQEDYAKNAKLSISPEPDSIQRIFMVYQPLEEYIDIPEQELIPWKREGFTVVEWGGALILPDNDN